MRERIPEDWSHTRRTQAAAVLPRPAPRIPEDFSLRQSEVVREEPAAVLKPKPLETAEEPETVRAGVFNAASVFVLALLGVALVFVIVEFYGLVVVAAKTNALLGAAAAILVAALFGAMAVISAREFRSYMALRSCRRLREAHERFFAGARGPEAAADLRAEMENYTALLEASERVEILALARELRERRDSTSTVREWADGLEKYVLCRMDEEVVRIIEKEALNVGLATAISPWGFMDAMITLWRNWTLVKRIARIYQVRAGFAGAARIFKNVIAAAALADLTQEAAGAFLGAFRGLTSLISPIGQGLANAALTARLGLLTQNECRPLPLPEESRRNILHVLKRSVMEEVRRRLRKRSAEERAKDSD